MKILTTTKNMKIKIEEQVQRSYSVTINLAGGSCIAASGFPTIKSCMEFANRFKQEHKKEDKK